MIDLDELDDAVRAELVQNANESSPIRHSEEKRDKKKSKKQTRYPVDKLNKLAPKHLNFSMEKKKEKHKSRKEGLLKRHKKDKRLSKKGKKELLKKEKPSSKTISKKEKILSRDIEQPGTWVQCDDCHKWRHLEDVDDPLTLPDKWMCFMNEVKEYNSCDIAEEEFEGLYDDDKFVYTEFNEGSLVWAKMSGFPWWPGMIDVDPDLETFIYFEEENDQYHVVFFGDTVSRAWLKPVSLMRFSGKEDINTFGAITMKGHNYRKPLANAKVDAIKALEMSLKDRLMKYGFATRFSGKFVEDGGSQEFTSTDVNKQLSEEDSENEDKYSDKEESEDEMKGIIRDWNDVYSDDDLVEKQNTIDGQNDGDGLKLVKQKKKKKSGGNKPVEFKEDQVKINAGADKEKNKEKCKKKLQTDIEENVNEKKDKKEKKKKKTDQYFHPTKSQEMEKKEIHLKKKKVKNTNSSSGENNNQPTVPKVKKPHFVAPKGLTKAQIKCTEEGTDTKKRENPTFNSEIFTMDFPKSDDEDDKCNEDMDSTVFVFGKNIETDDSYCNDNHKGQPIKSENGERSSETDNGEAKPEKADAIKRAQKKPKHGNKEDIKPVKKAKRPKFAAPIANVSSNRGTKRKVEEKDSKKKKSKASVASKNKSSDKSKINPVDNEIVLPHASAGLELQLNVVTSVANNGDDVGQKVTSLQDDNDSQPFEMEE